MPEILDHIAFLSQEIGPRPAGTEEEQQAALYITEQMQKEAGLSAAIEDFNSASNADLPFAICSAATIIITLVSLFLPIVAIPALIVAALSAGLMVLEALDRPVLSKLLTRGISQNVVTKYEPAYSAEQGGTRRRKIVLVANYDSGKVRAETKGAILGVLPVLQWASMGALVFVPVFLLIRDLFFLHADGVAAIVLNVITGIALVLVALPLIFAILHKFSAYNEGANCNAAGVAVMLEIAQRIGRGSVSVAELDARSAGVTVHGEEAAFAAGLVPEGAQLVYEAAQVMPPEPSPQTEEDRLIAAKEAIAALTGKPVPHTPVQTSVASNLVQVKGGAMADPSEEEIKELRDETRDAFASIPPETLEEAKDHAVSQQLEGALGEEAAPSGDPASAPQEGEFAVGEPEAAAVTGAASQEPAVPDWFKKAQEKAKKPKDEGGSVQRSRYADALDAAMAESSAHFIQANTATNNEIEERLQKMREGIMEVSAPQFRRDTVESEPSAPMTTDVDIHAAAGQPTPAPQAVDSPAADMGATISMPPINVEELRAQAAGQQSAPVATGTADAAQTPDIPAITPASFATAPVPSVSSDALSGLPSIEEDAGARTPIVLPEIGVASTGLTPIAEMPKQRAPLAVAEEDSAVAAKSLLTMLPTISATDESTPAAHESGALFPSGTAGTASRADLRSSLPSLSGAIRGFDDAEPVSSISAGAFVAAGATGTFAPVGDELLDDVNPEDIFVDDADDSDYTETMTETGAFTGSSYVEMPKSRARRFFDRFRKDKDTEEVSPHEWLDVEENFDAHEVGAARGGWESFQEEDAAFDDGYQEQGDGFRNGATETWDGLGFDDEDDDYSEGKNSWRGGAFSRSNRRDTVDYETDDYADDFSGYGSLEQAPAGFSGSGELDRIYQFRNPDINTEVWFVALGSELADNGGMKAFLREHEQDLRGSVIINIGALGGGTLSLVRREGKFKRFVASNRVSRYIQKASSASGINVGAADILWGDTAATVALRQGLQAFSVMGFRNGKPAQFAQGDDVLENIDDAALQQNADFIMELLKNI